MIVHVYSICWNELEMLEFYFGHYDQVASRYVFFDDGSTDGTLAMLEQQPTAEVRRFERSCEGSYVLSAQQLHNTVWRESRGVADWVIISAVDEHLFHPDLTGYLTRCLRAGVTMIPALGYQMISDTFPQTGADMRAEVTRASPFAQMSKLCVFRPDALECTDFSPGRHEARPTGEIVLPERDELLNLHYKYLSFDRVVERHKLLASGLGPEDRRRSFGHRYHFDASALRSDWMYFEEAAVDMSADGFDADVCHQHPRWWRDPARGYRCVAV